MPPASRAIPAPARERLPASSRPAFDGCPLTPSELHVIRHIASGLTYAEVAREMRLSTSTLRTHLSNAYGRLGVSSIAQALAACSQAGWLDEVPRDGAAVEFADRRVTWAQRLYLEAFDQSLRAGEDPEERERSQRLREAALAGVYNEAGGDPPPARRTTVDPLERIARAIHRLSSVTLTE
jgi:DNA-binding CsgD family transcriptional regulator